MKTLKFKCTLLSDVVLSAKAASVGSHRSLDFIPGNNFLGIVASRLYDKEDEKTRLLFHSGKVRFGDGHPAYSGIRSLRIPADLYKPKNEEEQEFYVHHLVPDLKTEELLNKQLKQCRTGFYTFRGYQAQKVDIDKTFAIKSAYNWELHRADDEQMFGYESITKGTAFYFAVELEDEGLQFEKEIIDALVGDRHLGRSRSAQYGWVKITLEDYSEPVSGSGTTDVTVYADGRLMFFDVNGLPTFQPTASDLGFTEGEIDWGKSQVRTFQYAPWNFKRQAPDGDRCGIEKGSVFVIKGAKAIPQYTYVGVYQNEGFGRIIYNPDFLKADAEGKSVLQFKEATKTTTSTRPTTSTIANAVLLKYLKKRKKAESAEKNTYEKVETFVKNHLKDFEGERFASQWGTIRGIAMSSNPQDLVKNIEKYLDHGVAKDQWDERNRAHNLLEFLKGEDVQVDLQNIVINLASEMAKKLRQKDYEQ